MDFFKPQNALFWTLKIEPKHYSVINLALQ